MANKVHVLEKNSNLSLEILEDNSAAYLIIKDGSDVIDADHIIELLNVAGVVSGFKEAAEENYKNDQQKDFNNQILVAKGSSDAVEPVTFLVNINSGFDPDNLLWQNLRDAKAVSYNTPLARINKISGTNTDIFGKNLSDEATSLNPEELIGKNVYFNKDDLTIYASQKGYLYLDDNGRLNITDQLKISESLQNSSLSSYGNLTIEGDVVDSDLEHDGDLTVKGNIVNCKNDGITVNGNLSFVMADNSNINAAGSINFTKDIRYCNCLTNGHISGSENSAFVGGSASAGSYIDVDKIGSPFHIATSMEIAIAPFQKMKIKKRIKKIEEIVPDTIENSQQSTQLALEENEFIKLLEQSIKNELNVYIKADKIIYSQTSLRVLDGSITLSTDLDGHRFAKNDPKLS